MIKVYLFLIIMGVLGAVGYGGYMYYKDTQSRIATLTANNKMNYRQQRNTEINCVIL